MQSLQESPLPENEQPWRAGDYYVTNITISEIRASLAALSSDKNQLSAFAASKVLRSQVQDLHSYIVRYGSKRAAITKLIRELVTTKQYDQLQPALVHLEQTIPQYVREPALHPSHTTKLSRSPEGKIRYHIRWMIRHDLPYVLHISGRSFDWDWSENDFLQCLRQRDCIGMVAEHGCSNIVGYMIYQLKKAKFHILNFAVHPAWRRMNVGGAMVEKLVAMLDNRRRTRLTMEIRESNLPGQSFFRKKEFAATGVTRNFYDDTGEDAYRMQYRAYPPNELELQEEQEGNQYVNDENGDRS